MINSRTLAISISWAVLSASLMSAQEMKPFDMKMMQQPLASIHVPGGLPALPIAGVSPSWTSSSGEIPDLSRYREFQFGMTLPEITKQAGLDSSAATIIHTRPAVIQEIDWLPRISQSPLSQVDPVKEILFSFLNGELFRMAVYYDRDKTEGLTVEDMVEAISVQYGKATRPPAETIASATYSDGDDVIASWEDSLYSFNLFRSSYKSAFGIMAFSKRLDGLAQTATVEAIRLDEQEAPQREIERRKKEAGVERAAQEKARLLNKPNFRP
ncbi:MAG: hypothetical protein PHX83_03880 [Acidobacteriia bacterium]|nr:hypothetical protein [Terriglobia bacterium]